MAKLQREQERAMFAKKRSKKGLSSISFNLRTPSRNVREQIKQRHIDSDGMFSQKNARHNDNLEKIRLDSIGILNVKKNQFVLKGVSPTDNKMITKVVALKN